MSNKIVVIVDSIDVNDSSGSKANVALIKGLVNIGYQISVYHYTRRNLQIENAVCYEIKEKKLNLLYLLSRAQRIVQRIFKFNLARHLEPLFGFSFTFFNDVNSIKTALKKVNISKTDLVLTLSKAASFRPHYAINRLPKFHNKWMTYIHDPYPFSRYPKPYDWKEPGYKIKETFFHQLSENSKYSVFPSLLLKEWMGNTFENFNKTGIVIPHQLIDVDLKEEDSPAYFESEKFNILHAGSLMKQRNPEGLIKGFQQFLDDNPKAKSYAKLLLLGNADYHLQMIASYSKKLPELIVKLSNNPFKEVFWLQKHVSVNVILETDAEVSPFLPGKFSHCVTANKPILHLGPAKSETSRLLGEEYPYISEITNAQKISKLIETLYNEWLSNNKNLNLNRPDLKTYLGEINLKKQIDTVLSND